MNNQELHRENFDARYKGVITYEEAKRLAAKASLAGGSATPEMIAEFLTQHTELKIEINALLLERVLLIEERLDRIEGFLVI